MEAAGQRRDLAAQPAAGGDEQRIDELRRESGSRGPGPQALAAAAAAAARRGRSWHRSILVAAATARRADSVAEARPLRRSAPSLERRRGVSRVVTRRRRRRRTGPSTSWSRTSGQSTRTVQLSHAHLKQIGHLSSRFSSSLTLQLTHSIGISQGAFDFREYSIRSTLIRVSRPREGPVPSLVRGGVAQLVRARGSYPRRPGFKSLHRHHFPPRRRSERVDADDAAAGRARGPCGSSAIAARRRDACSSRLSGGPDSVALLHALAVAAAPQGFRVVAAHLDHGLRPIPARTTRVLPRPVRAPRRLASHGQRRRPAPCAPRRRGLEERRARGALRLPARRGASAKGGRGDRRGPHPRRPGRDAAAAPAARVGKRRAWAPCAPRAAG